MRRLARATLTFAALSALLVLAACTDRPTTGTPLGPNALTPQVVADEEVVDLTLPLAGLTAAELNRFNQGRAVFERVFTEQSGLGPLFNSSSCAGCHEDPSVGGFGDDLTEDVETHVSAGTAGACDDLSAQGGVVIQQHTTPLLVDSSGVTTEPNPFALFGRRTTPALFGFGFLDAIPASTILALADPNDANADGISGRAQLDGGQPARFGRKATDAELLRFNAGAFMMEMGISNQFQMTEQQLTGFTYGAGVDLVAEPELSDADLALATDFVRFLAPPPQLRFTVEAKGGEALFAKLGCDGCHVPSLTTGSSPTKPLSRKPIAAFTDLLLHDMGPGLADICRGGADPSEFRTEPLMGLRFREHFLHDARATSVEQAIVLHAGEATASRDKFQALKANQKAALLAYLNSL